MLDLQTYVLYELFVSRQQEATDGQAKDFRSRRNQAEGNPFLARMLSAVGDILVLSGRKLKQRYEPMARRRVQTQN